MRDVFLFLELRAPAESATPAATERLRNGSAVIFNALAGCRLVDAQVQTARMANGGPLHLLRASFLVLNFPT